MMTRKINENKEAEAEDEEEFRSDNVKNKAPLLRSTNKLSLSTAREKPPSTASYQMRPLFITATSRRRNRDWGRVGQQHLYTFQTLSRLNSPTCLFPLNRP